MASADYRIAPEAAASTVAIETFEMDESQQPAGATRSLPSPTNAVARAARAKRSELVLCVHAEHRR